MSAFTFELGEQVEDVVTGLQGTVTARVEHLTGCNTYGVTPRLKEKGKVPEFTASYVDENRLKRTGGKRVVVGKPDAPASERGAGEHPSVRQGLR